MKNSNRTPKELLQEILALRQHITQLEQQLHRHNRPLPSSQQPDDCAQGLNDRPISADSEPGWECQAECSYMALQHSQLQRYQLLSHHSRDIALYVGLKGQILEANQSALRAYGYSSTELLSLNIADLRAANTHPVLAQQLAQATQQGILFETWHRRKDGSVFPVEVSAQSTVIDGETVILSLIRDISDRKQAEQEREQLLLQAQTARAQAEAAAQRAKFLAEASAVLNSSLDYKYTLKSVAQLVVPRLADWCVVDILKADRSLQRLVTAHTDPTKMAWAAELHRRYPLTLNSAHGIANVLRTGRSESYFKILDEHLAAWAQDAEHLKLLHEVGLRAAMIVPLVAREKVLGTLTLALAESGRAYTSDDLTFAEELACRVAIALDNARLYQETQQAQQAAVQANRIKDEFLAVLSHELRTPLNPILGWAKLLQSRPFSPQMMSRALETIERNAKLQTQLIEDLLDVSRILQGKLSLQIQAVDLTSTIAAALETVQLAAEARSIDLQFVNLTHQQPSLRVLGDAARLQQVVWNLLSNAIKFTPNQGQVQVQLSFVTSNPAENHHPSSPPDRQQHLLNSQPLWATDSSPEAAALTAQDSEPMTDRAEPITDYAQITVSDTGKGIHPEFLPHVFDCFRQADSSTTRSFGGLGLGLAIVRHIVELHGGKVQAASAGEEQGATFTVLLPLLGAPNSADVGQTPVNSTDLSGIHVLAVDDDPDMRDLLEIVLGEAGAAVTTVSSAYEALPALQQLKPDVLLADIGMPQVNGYSLLERVRALGIEQGGATPAIALTAYAGRLHQQQAIAAGFQMHLSKPIEPEALIRAIAVLTHQNG